jgi:hypothetical protein
MTTMNVLDATGVTVAIEKPLTPGRTGAASSRPVALSNEDLAAINAITTAIQATREDTLWTDDTGTYFVRVDKAGTISWTDISGTAASAPGTGARPADAASFAVDRSGFQATTSGTGYSTGDYLDHFVITDPNTGAVVSHFWLNVTTELKLASAPSSANITPFSAEAGVMGNKTDAKSPATDTTSVSGISIWKQISASVQAIAASIAGTNLIGRAVADASAATGGIASTARLASAAASTNATNVKTSAGRVYQASGKNNAAYDIFLVLYDAATNPPVPGTTTIRKKIICPAGQAFVYDWPVGLSFATGIGYAFTKLVADADTTVLVAADVTAFNLDYV